MTMRRERERERKRERERQRDFVRRGGGGHCYEEAERI